MNKKAFGYLVLGTLLAFGSCMRNDDEPITPQRPISRLYVSFESYRSSDTEDPIPNIAVIDPADTTVMADPFNYISNAMGGMGIHFNPFASRVFQAGRLDTTIHVMSVNNLGQLGTSGSIGNGLLREMRGIAYHFPSQLLYVANNVSPTRIFGFYQPMNRNGYTVPAKDLRLGDAMRPWEVVLWNDSLLVSNSAGQNGGFSLYANPSRADSVETNFTAISTVQIVGATSIRGMAFVDSLDVMVLADYGTEGAADGRVYIIEGVKAHLAQASATVTPTRTISGSQTGFSGPIDVAIDPRAEKRLIYVADRTNRTVSRFNLSDNGNVAPQALITFDNRAPFSLFLDARGAGQ